MNVEGVLVGRRVGILEVGSIVSLTVGRIEDSCIVGMYDGRTLDEVLGKYDGNMVGIIREFPDDGV